MGSTHGKDSSRCNLNVVESGSNQVRMLPSGKVVVVQACLLPSSIKADEIFCSESNYLNKSSELQQLKDFLISKAKQPLVFGL